METVEIPKDVWNPISSLVHHGLFENERSAIINIVHDLSLSKMKECELAIQEYEIKYGLVLAVCGSGEVYPNWHAQQ